MIPPDDVVLACYELAHFYHIDPEIFLNKTISELARSRQWTEKLTERQRAAQEAESDG